MLPVLTELLITQTSLLNMHAQRAVGVAFMLHLMGNAPVTAFSDDDASSALRKHIAQLITRSGVALDAILYTIRFREELDACRRMLLPPSVDKSNNEGEPFGGDESDENEWSDEDESDSKVLFQTAATPWDLCEYEYFVKPDGQECDFASWSADGIRNFAFVLLVELEGSSLLSNVISTRSWLFVLAPSIQSLLQSEGNTQVRGRV